MSIDTVERVLFDIASTPLCAAQFKSNPRDFLENYPLSSQEVEMVIDLDVAEMVRRGLNPMLTMRVFTTLEGRASLPEYMRRMKECSSWPN